MIEKNKLLQSIIEGIQEKKGKNISTIQLEGISGAICDYFVICEGNSPTQVSALAESIEYIVKKNTQRKPFACAWTATRRVDRHGLRECDCTYLSA